MLDEAERLAADQEPKVREAFVVPWSAQVQVEVQEQQEPKVEAFVEPCLVQVQAEGTEENGTRCGAEGTEENGSRCGEAAAVDTRHPRRVKTAKQVQKGMCKSKCWADIVDSDSGHSNKAAGILGKPTEGAETEIPQAGSACKGAAATKEHHEAELNDKEVEAIAAIMGISVEGIRRQFAAATVAERGQIRASFESLKDAVAEAPRIGAG